MAASKVDWRAAGWAETWELPQVEQRAATMAASSVCWLGTQLAATKAGLMAALWAAKKADWWVGSLVCWSDVPQVGRKVACWAAKRVVKRVYYWVDL
jgi:hypothetical protein